MPLPKPDNQKYTYADYLTWTEEERWEIIDGVAYQCSAPTWEHQQISGAIFNQFYNYLTGKTCRIFHAPFDLRLPESGEADLQATTTNQPDLTIICDQSKLSGTGYCGTPPMIIEIMSPTNEKCDRKIKLRRYERAGVKELWLVVADRKYVEVYLLQESGKYSRPEYFYEDEKIPVSIFPDLEIDLQPVFEGI